MTKNMYENDQGDILLMAKSQHMKWEDYIADCDSVELRLKLGATHTKAAPIRLALFRPLCGARLLWCMGDFHKLIGMDCKSYPSRWVASLWKRWEQFAVEVLRLDPIHCRMSNLRRTETSSERVLDFASCSTMVVVGLLLRFVSLHRARGRSEPRRCQLRDIRIL